jgi:hypothetical protein
MTKVRLLTISLASFVLTSCSIPGVETTRIYEEGRVDVGGQMCEFVSRVSETPTVNGMSRFYSSTVTCGQQTYECNDNLSVDCVAQIAAARAGQ